MTISPAAVSRLVKGVKSRLSPRLEHCWYLISTATSAASGLGNALVPHIYRQAVAGLASDTPGRSAQARISFHQDSPRRQVVRQLKETLVKSTILVGVGHCIEASLSLAAALDETDRDHTFVRQGFESDGKSHERGVFGLDRIYQDNIHAIMDKFHQGGLHDIRWLSRNVTYGQLLTPTRPEYPLAALTLQETEIVVLSCLMARHAHREVLWHLRGCLRAGMSREEVERCQQAIEVCLDGLRDMQPSEHPPMPRVDDVKEHDDL